MITIKTVDKGYEIEKYVGGDILQSLDNDIKSGKFKRVYLIYGEESFLVKEYENKLKEV